MADWDKPALTDAYADFLTYVKARDEDLAKMFDGTSSTNLVSGYIGWNSTNNRFEKYNGATWDVLSTKYMINVDTVDSCNVNDAGTTTSDLLTASKILSLLSPKLVVGSDYTITGKWTFGSWGLSTGGKDLYLDNGTLIVNDGDGAFVTRSGSNIDHMWHDEATNTWHFCSDTTYKANGNSIVYAASFKEAGTSLSAKYLGISATAAKATILATSRTISMGGDVSGSESFDGSSNITITCTVSGLGDKIEADDYATSTVGGTVKMRLDGSVAYIRNDGTDA